MPFLYLYLFLLFRLFFPGCRTGLHFPVFTMLRALPEIQETSYSIRIKSVRKPNLWVIIKIDSVHGLVLQKSFLLTAVSSNVILKSKPAKENIYYNKELLDFQYIFLSQMNDLLKESENNRPGFFDYSPMQWILPSGPVEILILSVVEMHLLSKFSDVIAEKSRPGIRSSEMLIERMPASEKIFYKHKFDSLKNEYLKSKSFQALQKKDL